MKPQFKILLSTFSIAASVIAQAQKSINLSGNFTNSGIVSSTPVIVSNAGLNQNSIKLKTVFKLPYSDTTISKERYLIKSRHQKTIAWIMLGGGAGLTALGFAIASTNAITNSSNSDAGANVLAIAGLASMAGSIPLFISASHNKKKAAMVTLNMQNIPVLNTSGNLFTASQAVLHFKIDL